MQNLNTWLQSLKPGPGVYIFKDSSNRPLYIGKSTDVPERVKSHLKGQGPKASAILTAARKIEGIPVNYELEALLLEAELIKKYEPPYNSRVKDDRHPLYIKITKEEFPKVMTSRREERDARYWGPFPSSATVRRVLAQIRKIFPFCAQKKVGGRACLYSHMGLCNPCPNEISKIKNHPAKPDERKLKREQAQKYKSNIKNIVRLLSGKTDALTKELKRQMRDAAGREDFEEAAGIRDQLARLGYITAPYRPATAFLENPSLVEDLRHGEQQQLFQILKRHISIKKIERVECFDVSHLRGDLQTASMVTFVQGEPDKNFYRHFRIRALVRADDFAMISEVLRRRLTHLEDWGRPDLIIVDGGKPQISAADTVLKRQKLNIPLIGLAKRNEEIIFLQKNPKLGVRTFQKIILPRNSAALHLVQRLRDEAHRFARSYHLKLRMKQLHNNIDD